MIESLRIPESAVYYKITHQANGNPAIPRVIYTQIFDKMINVKSGTNIYRRYQQIETVGTIPILYSICIFNYEAVPSFLKTDNNRYLEINFGYLLAVEYDGYLAVSKKYVDGFEVMIENYAEQVSPQIINHYRLDSKSRIGRLVMKNADQGRGGIKEKTIEADEVENSYSPVGSERQLVRGFRLDTNKGSMNFSSTTSQVTILGPKGDFQKYLERITGEIQLIKNYKHQSNYLDHFAEHIPFKQVSKLGTPLFGLITWYEVVQQMISEGSTIELEFTDATGVDVKIGLDDIAELFSYTFNVVKGATNFKLEIDPASVATLSAVQQNLCANISMIELKSKFRLDCGFWKSVRVTIDSNPFITLNTLINDRSLLHLNFNPPELIYSSGALHREKDFSKRAELVLNILEGFPNLVKTSVEKHAGKSAKGLTAFSADSIFTWIENSRLTATSDYVVCDDLGNEWADYLTIEPNSTIRFLHAKSGNKTLGASKFHDVVSQALKNVGNLRSYALLDDKSKQWAGNYSTSSILKIRKYKGVGVHSTQAIADVYKEYVLNPDTAFESWLVVNFISISKLEKEIDNYKKGKGMNNFTMQLVSLLLRYISACQEVNVKPKIACLP